MVLSTMTNCLLNANIHSVFKNSYSFNDYFIVVSLNMDMN
jgi:hypothetical protein